MKLIHATLSARKGIGKCLHQYGGPGSSCMSVKSHIESSFCHCSGPVELVQASLCVRKDIESIFYYCRVPYSSQFECLEGSQVVFTIVARPF